MDCYDVTIIGGGPAGLYSAFYSGLREMKTKVIESQPQLGGKLHIYPEKMIWDVGGQTPIPCAKLIDQLTQQGLTFNPTVVLNEKVSSISKRADGIFVLTTGTGQKHYSKTVIVSVGSGVLKPQKLHIDGAERFEISNLHYTVKSLMYFKDKTVVLSGGGNTAIDWANALEPVAKKVYVTYRKPQFKGHESQVTQLLNSTAECLFNTSITKLIANESQDEIKSVELTNSETGKIVQVDIDDVVINHGFEQDTSLLQNSELNIKMLDNFFIEGNACCETSIPGLYAAGDIIKYDGKVNLIMGAFQDAANAVNKAKQFIQPDATAAGMVSSHNEVFKEKNRELVKKLIMR
ncbi:NAD(P)/FAD-dependent oxidoreductase [Bacillus sp. HMF5848]|uniref:NAD(P)/FAD-dependent oxidoreductase n=1 Tax=Bacillus sp. HMF5848 TaxID=2495421 RepID=UPI000F786EC4|nr:NAD(P)/FAD-dependent oxidoreductase [Bacillus sp. HMF5848]RSK26178.1 NAD(P)/FAD-dependent oxidoreductase [Bacillus sp. HMF5848]